jgi:aryl-alcohol dehydrogenase-like predicted oxidoreductase
MPDKIQKLILGTVQFGLDYGINNPAGKPSESEVEKILVRAYESGIRCLDTAEVYGTAHKIIGNFHRKYPDIRFDIISKIPGNFHGSITTKIESYLKELNVDSLKGFLFHSFESYQLNKDEIVKLSALKAQGQIESIGVSAYTNLQIEEILQDEFINIVQLPFNLLDNINLRGEMLSKINDSGKIVHTRSAFLQGLFFVESDSDNKIAKSLKPELDYLKNVAIGHNITMQKLAINYCIQQPLIQNVLIGVDNLDQLNQNLSDATYLLSSNLIKQIEEIKVKQANLLNPSLWN